MISISIDAKKAIADLKKFRERALPFAVRNALNRSAFQAREVWQGEIRRSFTNRNAFTERSVRVERATGYKPGRMVAIVGSVASYMDEQERGAVIHGRGAHKGIPGPSAAGQAPGTKRTRVVRAAFKLSALHASRGVGKTRLQRNAVAIAIARRAGGKAVLLERPAGGKGIFKLMGGRRKAQTRLLWDLSRGSVRIKPTPTLARTMKIIQPKAEQLYVDAVVEQLRRHKILGY